jgi:hypothetical protein
LEWTVTQGHPPSPDNQDALYAAVCRYAEAFPDEGLPLVFSVRSKDWPIAIVTLDAAVKVGQPLDWWAVMAALGIEQPPLGG